MARVSTPRQTSLERNIIKYAWYKVVTKRVFLPLIAIQLVNAGQVTVGEIAQIAIITSLAQIILQLPTGYFADRFGNKRAIVIGALIAAPSPLFYIVMPNFLGGLLASLLFLAVGRSNLARSKRLFMTRSSLSSGKRTTPALWDAHKASALLAISY